MKIRTLQQIIHNLPPGDDRIWMVIPPGSIVDMPEGEEWVAHGLAVPVVEIGAPEKAVIKAPEKRVKKSSKSR